MGAVLATRFLYLQKSYLVSLGIQGTVLVADHFGAEIMKRSKCVVFMLRCQPFVEVKLGTDRGIKLQGLCCTL